MQNGAKTIPSSSFLKKQLPLRVSAQHRGIKKRSRGHCSKKHLQKESSDIDRFVRTLKLVTLKHEAPTYSTKQMMRTNEESKDNPVGLPLPRATQLLICHSVHFYTLNTSFLFESNKCNTLFLIFMSKICS